MYQWQQVKTLKAEGVSIKKIVRLLKISKNTVKRKQGKKAGGRSFYFLELW
jgi:DNA invertase Pin-like site-specific DNA recombinase